MWTRRFHLTDHFSCFHLLCTALSLDSASTSSVSSASLGKVPQRKGKMMKFLRIHRGEIGLGLKLSVSVKSSVDFLWSTTIAVFDSFSVRLQWGLWRFWGPRLLPFESLGSPRRRRLLQTMAILLLVYFSLSGSLWSNFYGSFERGGLARSLLLLDWYS